VRQRLFRSGPVADQLRVEGEGQACAARGLFTTAGSQELDLQMISFSYRRLALLAVSFEGSLEGSSDQHS
jgi:hypothetical protein